MAFPHQKKAYLLRTLIKCNRNASKAFEKLFTESKSVAEGHVGTDVGPAGTLGHAGTVGHVRPVSSVGPMGPVRPAPPQSKPFTSVVLPSSPFRTTVGPVGHPVGTVIRLAALQNKPLAYTRSVHFKSNI